MNEFDPPPPLIVLTCGYIIIQYMLTKIAPPITRISLETNYEITSAKTTEQSFSISRLNTFANKKKQ